MLLCLGVQFLHGDKMCSWPLFDSYLLVCCLPPCVARRLLPCDTCPCNAMAKLVEASCIGFILGIQHTFCKACKTRIDFTLSLCSCQGASQKRLSQLQASLFLVYHSLNCSATCVAMTFISTSVQDFSNIHLVDADACRV